jgi:hypothetical protein
MYEDLKEAIVKLKSRTELPKFFTDHNLTNKMCEIGVFRGDNLSLYVNTFEYVYGIDVWDRKISRSAFRKYKGALKRFLTEKNCKLIRGDANDMADIFDDDDVFDFVYLDGDHSYEAVSKELPVWFKKVKKGGIFAGHDYSNRIPDKYPGVKSAVDEFLKEKGIEFLHILDADRTGHSWVTIKE